jgi:hypothetical protein
MEEENKPAPSFLEQIQREREALDTSIKESQAKIEELRELRAVEILSGRTNAGKTDEKPKQETPKEYAARVMKGAI